MRRSPWLLLLCLAACAGFSKPSENAKPAGSLERVKTDPKGVCAAIVNPTTEPWSTKPPEGGLKLNVGNKLIASNVQVCARVQRDASGPGEGSVLAVELSVPREDEHWRPEYWHVEVIRPKGLVVLAGNLDAGRTEDGVCVLDTCAQEAFSSLAMPEPWQVGTYRIRLIHVPTRKRVEVAITLN